MKKLLILLFITLALLIQGCGSKTICVETNDVQNRDGTYYLVNQQKPFTGDNLCVYTNSGQEHSKGKIKKGKKDGKWTFWYENGAKELGGSYKDGNKDGKWTDWWDGGQKYRERNYKDGKLVGKVTEWARNGQINATATYKDGKCISETNGGCGWFKNTIGMYDGYR